MKKLIIAVVLACAFSAAAGATVTKRVLTVKPGDTLAIRTAALNCKVGLALITCTDPRRRSKHLTIKLTRTELVVTRPVRRKRPRLLYKTIR